MIHAGLHVRLRDCGLWVSSKPTRDPADATGCTAREQTLVSWLASYVRLVLTDSLKRPTDVLVRHAQTSKIVDCQRSLSSGGQYVCESESDHTYQRKEHWTKLG